MQTAYIVKKSVFLSECKYFTIISFHKSILHWAQKNCTQNLKENMFPLTSIKIFKWFNSSAI